MSESWRPRYVVAHDYAVPDGVALSRTAANPYNALVYPDGTVRYRNPSNPYGTRAPHAAGLNPYSVGLGYAGPYGGTPTPAAMGALRQELDKVRQLYPGIIPITHGDAYQKYRGTPLQASRSGRDHREARWLAELLQQPDRPAAPLPGRMGLGIGSAAPVAPDVTPPALQERSLVTYAGLRDAAPVPPVASPAAPMERPASRPPDDPALDADLAGLGAMIRPDALRRAPAPPSTAPATAFSGEMAGFGALLAPPDVTPPAPQPAMRPRPDAPPASTMAFADQARRATVVGGWPLSSPPAAPSPTAPTTPSSPSPVQALPPPAPSPYVSPASAAAAASGRYDGASTPPSQAGLGMLSGGYTPATWIDVDGELKPKFGPKFGASRPAGAAGQFWAALFGGGR